MGEASGWPLVLRTGSERSRTRVEFARSSGTMGPGSPLLAARVVSSTVPQGYLPFFSGTLFRASAVPFFVLHRCPFCAVAALFLLHRWRSHSRCGGAICGTTPVLSSKLSRRSPPHCAGGLYFTTPLLSNPLPRQPPSGCSGNLPCTTPANSNPLPQRPSALRWPYPTCWIILCRACAQGGGEGW